MSDLISRQAAIDVVMKYCLQYDLRDLLAELEVMPSAQPEIIRCKDCRYYEWMNNRVPAEQTWFCQNWNAETGKDDYCSYAERQEE